MTILSFSVTRELIVIMELVTTTTYDCVVSDSLLREKVTKLEAELSLLQPASSRDSAGTNRGLLTSTEVRDIIVDNADQYIYIVMLSVFKGIFIG